MPNFAFILKDKVPIVPSLAYPTKEGKEILCDLVVSIDDKNKVVEDVYKNDDLGIMQNYKYVGIVEDFPCNLYQGNNIYFPSNYTQPMIPELGFSFDWNIMDALAQEDADAEASGGN